MRPQPFRADVVQGGLPLAAHWIVRIRLRSANPYESRIFVIETGFRYPVGPRGAAPGPPARPVLITALLPT